MAIWFIVKFNDCVSLLIFLPDLSRDQYRKVKPSTLCAVVSLLHTTICLCEKCSTTGCVAMFVTTTSP